MTTTAPPAPEARPDSATAHASPGLRTDIQALRALAVGAVMLYHLWPNRLPGGYVGVDVFFVISGFLISSHLLGELATHGRVRLATFWARRAKRLIPASTLVLLASGVAIVGWVPRRLWQQFFDEIIASALQFQNWLLAHDSVDYLAAENAPSPTQHFWTLSVEEQFYVGLPLLLLATAWAGRGARRRRVIAIVLAVVVVASFAYGVYLTRANPSLAYFSTFTRAWEFALGGLLALIMTRTARARSSRGRHTANATGRGTATVVAGAGLAAIVVACFAFTGATPFPGVAAALPVFGTLAVLWLGGNTPVVRVGAWSPVALLGRISYACYLWHWPMLVLLPFATGHRLSSADKVGIIVVTLAVAWASTRFVEDPIRFNPRLLGRRRPRVVAAFSAIPVVTVLALALITQHAETRHEQQLVSEARQALQVTPRCFGAQAKDPDLAPCHNPALTGKIYPDTTTALHDDASDPACWAAADGTPRICHLGPTSGYRKKIFAVGDSHNNALTGVLRQIAQQNHWRIDGASRQSCYLSTAVRVLKPQQLVTSCQNFNRKLIEIAKAGDYDAVIVTHAGFHADLVEPFAGRTIEQTLVDGMVQAWQQLPNIPIVAIRDNPTVRADNLTCVADHPADAATRCTTPRDVALKFDGQVEAARRVPRATVLDFTSFYCNDTVCPEVVGNALVYRDDSHLTKTFARSMTPYINDKLTAALADAGPR